MASAKISSLPDAHQQIRLGDLQVSAQKWTVAIEYYLRAIEYFKAIQNTLQDNSLISIIHEQIVQCEKTIHLCRLKDRSEQGLKAEHQSKITRAHSVSNIKPSTRIHRTMPRHNTLQLENAPMLDARNDMDSFLALIFPKNNEQIQRYSKSPPRVVAKKNTKNDSHKMEELKTSYEATKSHLKVAFDEIDRLKHENNQLRLQREVNNLLQQIDSELLSSHHEMMGKDESDNELEATL